MINMKPTEVRNFQKIYDKHKNLNFMIDVLYDHIKLLTMKHKVVDRPAYKTYCADMCADVKMETPPFDVFMQSSDDGGIEINRDVPEWKAIENSVLKDSLLEALPTTHPLHIHITDKPDEFDMILDDILIHCASFIYVDEIEKLIMNSYMNATPLIEWICGGDTIFDSDGFVAKQSVPRGAPYDKLKYMISDNKLRMEKIEKQGYIKDIVFLPTMLRNKDFYSQRQIGDKQIDISCFEKLNLPPFDMEKVILKMASHTVLKSDRFLILGIYLLLSFSVADIINIDKFETPPPCVKYIQEVISKI